MKKKFKRVGFVLALTMGLTLFSGCNRKINGVDAKEMINKYAAMCTLADYKGIEYVQSATPVTDDTVQSYIDSLLAQHSVTEKITTGVAKDGDTVNIDFVGSVDGVEFEGGNSGGVGYDITLGSGRFIPGFEDQIVGHSVGDKFDVVVTFPDPYMNEELSGKEAVFAVTLNHISVTTVPEYTDEFVASNTDSSTIAEYEETVRAELEETYGKSDLNNNKSAIITAVIEASTINEYPEKEMEELINETVSGIETDARTYGYDLATYVQTMYGMESEEVFRDYVSRLAMDYLNEKIIICAIAKAEGIKVNKDEVDEFKKSMMDDYGILDEKKFDENFTAEDIVYYTLAEKVIDFLLENGTPVEATSTDAQ